MAGMDGHGSAALEYIGLIGKNTVLNCILWGLGF